MPVSPGRNTLTFAALDDERRLLETATVHVTGTGSGISFIRGDFNLYGRVDIGDPVRILLHLFVGKPAECEDAGDLDDNEVLDISDVLFELFFLFRRGVAPLEPYPEAGEDPGGEGPLGCEKLGPPNR